MYNISDIFYNFYDLKMIKNKTNKKQTKKWRQFYIPALCSIPHEIKKGQTKENLKQNT